MSDLNSTINSIQDDTDEDNSDDNLKIVIESPRRKSTVPDLNEEEKLFLKKFEENLEKELEEKAAKTNLNVTNVKNLLKHVVTNEHVLALVRNAENPEHPEEPVVVYEPKLTRAKAKELSTNPIPQVPWIKPVKKKSEVEVLFNEDLQEDSSGDEYVPEESEDERDSTVVSDYEPPNTPLSTSSTPPKNLNSPTQINWTDDGVFKIPPSKSQKEEAEEKANIALRTRSKLCLSSTPLEVIEEAFVPPDIPIDIMEDMDYDDDEWKDFLKEFTRPLDEITKAGEDDDHDPEYNILADEEIDKVDREELRMDKAVKVSRKELNDLMAELFDCCDSHNVNSKTFIQPQHAEITTDTNNMTDQMEQVEKDIIEPNQIPLLAQQIRQHIQILTQNFLLTYEHPEYHSYSSTFKEYLLNLKFLCTGKQASAFYGCNLPGALQLIQDWEELFATNNKEVQETKEFVLRVLSESKSKRNTDIQCSVTFPPLILKTISNSDVFLYPMNLPRIPFKSLSVFSKNTTYMVPGEDHLIALGIEQFSSFAKQDKRNLTKVGEVRLKVVAELIEKYMMPTKFATKIYYHICNCRKKKSEDNPISYYFIHNRVQPMVHYVAPLDQLAPRYRPLAEIPQYWRRYIQNCNKQDLLPSPSVVHVLVQTFVQSPSNYKLILPKAPIEFPTKSKKRNRRRKCRTFGKVIPDLAQCTNKTPATSIQKFVECLQKPISPSKLVHLFHEHRVSLGLSENEEELCENMPNMPNLCTPIKTNNVRDSDSDVKLDDTNKEVVEESKTDVLLVNRTEVIPEQESEDKLPLGPEQVTSSSDDVCAKETPNEDSSSQELSNNNLVNTVEKDNPDDINALMIASSTVKPIKKEPSGAEKKRAKIRREFVSNLIISTPENPILEKEKNENFALAYYDKMREVLKLEDYHNIMQILNEHDGDAIDLYKKVEKVMKPDYEQLAEEFLLFLRENEAAAVGQLVPWIKMNVSSKFLRKLEIYFKDQPAQLRKIYKCLTELSQSMDYTMEKIKSTLIPMLKGNAILVDLFLQSFVDQTPPASLLEGPYETIDINKEVSRPENEELVEHIIVPETEDKFGGSTCTCSCHKIEDPEFKSRQRHCIPCGTRFMQGKVYIQSGRGLLPATVSFLTSPDVDHNIRLNGKPSTSVSQRRRRPDTSPSKQATISPSKENGGDEESDEDGDGKKKSRSKKTPRKRKKQPDKPKVIKEKTKSKKAVVANCDPSKTEGTSPKETKTKKRTATCSSRKSKVKIEKQQIEYKSETIKEEEVQIIPKQEPEQHLSIENQEPELMEWDYATNNEIKLSPGQNTAESESEFCEESSQDNCESDSNSSMSSTSNAQSQSDGNGSEDTSWKREEDKVILETFKRENDKEHAFRVISHQLKNRTVSQIRNRFQTLLNLIMEQVVSRT